MRPFFSSLLRFSIESAFTMSNFEGFTNILSNGFSKLAFRSSSSYSTLESFSGPRLAHCCCISSTRRDCCSVAVILLRRLSRTLDGLLIALMSSFSSSLELLCCCSPKRSRGRAASVIGGMRVIFPFFLTRLPRVPGRRP